MKIKPLGDRVVIKPLTQEAEKVGSLFIPDTAKEKPMEGVIEAVGPGKRDGDKFTPLEVKVGDRVLYGKYSGTEIKSEGNDYLIVREGDILAVLG